jgi:hypothetical protein
MKHTIIAVLTVLFFITMGTTSALAKTGKSSATAGNVEVEGSMAVATGPGSYDSGFGVSFGAGYALSDIDRNLQARFDFSYFSFKKDYSWGSGTYTRVPFTVSARYYAPVFDKLRVFGQAGVETSMDTFDDAGHHRNNEVNIGLSPGAGIELIVNPNLSFFAQARAHFISDSYVSMHFGVASYF